MKSVFAIVLLAAIVFVVRGSPLTGPAPVSDRYYDSPAPILPMSFAHLDDIKENCILCHHNYVDDTGGGLCMTCHVTDASVWPLLEEQFHGLCRGCHEDKAALGEVGGPPRRCIDCHRGDDLP